MQVFSYLSKRISLVVSATLCHLFLNKARDEEIDRYYQKRHYGFLILSGIITVVLVYFTSGYFRFWSIAVASGSMYPVIRKGDVVIIEKLNTSDYSKVKKGDILAFTYDKVTIVHRVINIVKENNHYYFYTKGDANRHEDDFVIEEEMVIGVVNVKIPLIGMPTVWLNEL